MPGAKNLEWSQLIDPVLASIRDLRPTYFPAVPTVFVSLLNHPKVGEYGLEHVRLFNSGGAPCPR